MSDVSEKWGAPVAQRGFAQVPNYLLLINQFLDEDHRLSPAELLVLIQLVGSWWKKDALPFPSMATLAKRCGVSTRQIQRAVNKLESAGFIQRVKRRSRGIISSNAYDLAPLVAVLGEVAKAFPNEYPRVVDKATAARIQAALKAAQANEEAADDAFEAVTTPAPAKAKLRDPNPPRKLTLKGKALKRPTVA